MRARARHGCDFARSHNVFSPRLVRPRIRHCVQRVVQLVHALHLRAAEGAGRGEEALNRGNAFIVGGAAARVAHGRGFRRLLRLPVHTPRGARPSEGAQGQHGAGRCHTGVGQRPAAAAVCRRPPPGRHVRLIGPRPIPVLCCPALIVGVMPAAPTAPLSQRLTLVRGRSLSSHFPHGVARVGPGRAAAEDGRPRDAPRLPAAAQRPRKHGTKLGLLHRVAASTARRARPARLGAAAGLSVCYGAVGEGEWRHRSRRRRALHSRRCRAALRWTCAAHVGAAHAASAREDANVAVETCISESAAEALGQRLAGEDALDAVQRRLLLLRAVVHRRGKRAVADCVEIEAAVHVEAVGRRSALGGHARHELVAAGCARHRIQRFQRAQQRCSVADGGPARLGLGDRGGHDLEAHALLQALGHSALGEKAGARNQAAQVLLHALSGGGGPAVGAGRGGGVSPRDHACCGPRRRGAGTGRC